MARVAMLVSKVRLTSRVVCADHVHVSTDSTAKQRSIAANYVYSQVNLFSQCLALAEHAERIELCKCFYSPSVN